MSTIISGTSGITFPAGGVGNPAGAVVGTTDTQTLANKTIGSGYSGSTITSGTVQASTSGTSIDFTGIPAWVKRITVMFKGVSTNGSSNILVQIGSGSVTTTGYVSGAAFNGSTPVFATSTSGFIVHTSVAPALIAAGSVSICLQTGNSWVSSGIICQTVTGSASASGGYIDLSGALDRVRVTTANGTDTFDAGSINILYE